MSTSERLGFDPSAELPLSEHALSRLASQVYAEVSGVVAKAKERRDAGDPSPAPTTTPSASVVGTPAVSSIARVPVAPSIAPSIAAPSAPAGPAGSAWPGR
ncbi:MAG: hypothetical protein WBP48_13385, partial [Microbacterium sp.]